MADNMLRKPGIGRGLSDGVVVALSDHRQNERGYCWKDGERWPCLTDQLRVAREWAALWKRAAKAKHGALAAERSRAEAAVRALEESKRRFGRDGVACWCPPGLPSYWHTLYCEDLRAALAAAAAATPPAAVPTPGGERG